MIDTVLNLLFNCPHRHLTRPFTPVNHGGVAHGEKYVVCLDCAKQFAYDLTTMRIGRPIDHSHEAFVVHPAMPHPHKTKLKYERYKQDLVHAPNDGINLRVAV